MFEIPMVKNCINANVNIYTLSNGEKSISIMLELQSDLPAEMIEYLVVAVSGATGSKNADNIAVVDTDGNVLYSEIFSNTER